MARILIVDDESDILFILRVVLESAGYEVVQALDGQEALDAIPRAHPDLVITDLMMPVMDGRELIRRLRENPSTASIPVMMVSANPNGTVGAEVLMRKPFRHEDLLRNVRALLGEAS